MAKRKKDMIIPVPVAVTTQSEESNATKTVKEIMEVLDAPMGMVLVRDGGETEKKKASQAGYSAAYASAWEEMMRRRSKIKQ